MVLFKNAIRHSGQKNITDTPLGPALPLYYTTYTFKDEQSPDNIPLF